MYIKSFFFDWLSRCWSEIPGRKEIGDRVNQLEQDRDMEQKKRKGLGGWHKPLVAAEMFLQLCLEIEWI